MSRIGFMCQEFPRDNYSIEEIKQASQMEYLNLEGIFTHFCVSDEADDGREFTNANGTACNYTRKSEAFGLSLDFTF